MRYDRFLLQPQKESVIPHWTWLTTLKQILQGDMKKNSATGHWLLWLKNMPLICSCLKLHQMPTDFHKSSIKIPPHLKCVITLPCKNLVPSWLRMANGMIFLYQPRQPDIFMNNIPKLTVTANHYDWSMLSRRLSYDPHQTYNPRHTRNHSLY